MKIVIIVFLISIVGIQFILVDHTNPPVTGEISLPYNLKSAIKKSCYNCHSNETKWPWYSYVAPVSWFIVKDVKDGRKHLNFSEWNLISLSKREKIMEEIWEEVEAGEMPMGTYVIMHPEAKLTADELRDIGIWTGGSKRKKKTRFN